MEKFIVAEGLTCETMTEWQLIETAPEDVEIETKIDDHEGTRNVQTLTRKGKLWFFPDMSMYVYYTPTHWRALPDPDRKT